MKKTILLFSLGFTLVFSGDNAVIFGLKDGGTLSLREAPIKGAKIGQLKNNDKLTIIEQQGKWYKVNVISSKKIGWAHGDWIKVFPKKRQIISNIKTSTIHPATPSKVIPNTTVSKPSKVPYLGNI